MTVANLITILRFLLVPGVVCALLTGPWRAGPLPASWSPAFPTASTVSSPAISTSAPKLGAYLDPMADKLLLVSVFVVLGFIGQLPLWLVIAAVSRDALIVCAVLLSTIMGHPVEMKPLMVSKANTAVQIVLAAVVLARTRLRRRPRRRPRRRSILLSGLLTVASAAAYLVAWLRHMSGIWRRRDLPTDELRQPTRRIAGAFRRQISFWLITAVVLALFLYVFSAILLPFVAGMVLAYFLDPVADRLERLGLSRTAGDAPHPVRLPRRADARRW